MTPLNMSSKILVILLSFLIIGFHGAFTGHFLWGTGAIENALHSIPILKDIVCCLLVLFYGAIFTYAYKTVERCT